MNIIDTMTELTRDGGYLAFQNSLTQDFYDTLAQGYSLNENEVALVKRLVEITDGKSYGPLRLYGRMLHGTRSYVEFRYRDRPVTKELGDMAVIAVVTKGHKRLFQRLCIVQNKKASGRRWSLDLQQLFLLKNFPPISGDRGIFSGRHEIAFRNISGCLGAFGLLAEPSEMTLASAALVTEFCRGKKSINMSDMLDTGHSRSAGTGGWPWHPDIWYLMRRYGFVGLPGSTVLGNTTFCRDLYDFTRSWTQISLGEPTVIDDALLDASADGFANLLLRSALPDVIRAPPGEVFAEMEFGGTIALLVAHLELPS